MTMANCFAYEINYNRHAVDIMWVSLTLWTWKRAKKILFSWCVLL